MGERLSSGSAAEWRFQAVQPPSELGSRIPAVPAVMGIQHGGLIPGSTAEWRAQPMPVQQQGPLFSAVPQHGSGMGFQHGGMVSGNAMEWQSQVAQQQLQSGLAYEQQLQQQPFFTQNTLRPPQPPQAVMPQFVPSVVPPPPPMW